jgi:lysozyme
MYSVLEAAMALRDVNQATVDLVKQYEGIPDGNPATDNIDPYLDPVGIWTIGWGHAITYQGRFLKGLRIRRRCKACIPVALHSLRPKPCCIRI